MTEGEKRRISKKTGPRKVFLSVKEMREKVVAEVKPEFQGELRSIIEDYKEIFPEKLPRVVYKSRESNTE